MRIKSFYASTVEGAVALARQELGPDAMLVQSRKSPIEARHLGEYEVVCAVVPETESSSAPFVMPGPVSQDARLAQELAELRRQLDSMGRTITRSAWSGSRWASTNPAMADWHARLIAADLDPEFATQILDAVPPRAGADLSSTAQLDQAVFAELQKRIPVNATLGQPADGLLIAALVGPPGAGKTTTLAKLAVQHGLAVRRPVRLLSMDDYRVGGAEQLRSYAMILGAGFQALETVGALAQALEEPRKGLILIDTPGYGARDMDRAIDLARFLSTRSGISTHLVLTASTKSADLLRVVNRFEIFRPSSLLFTRLDETDSFGTALSAAAHFAKPLSFLGTGQEIPDDLEPATHDRILNWMVPSQVCAMRPAA
jgi:flagellar biosynthesis protein FlhF